MLEMKLVDRLEDVQKLSAADSSTRFDQAIVQLMEQVRVGSTRGIGRWMELSVPRLYTLIHKARKRQREDDPD